MLFRVRLTHNDKFNRGMFFENDFIYTDSPRAISQYNRLINLINNELKDSHYQLTLSKRFEQGQWLPLDIYGNYNPFNLNSH